MISAIRAHRSPSRVRTTNRYGGTFRGGSRLRCSYGPIAWSRVTDHGYTGSRQGSGGSKRGAHGGLARDPTATGTGAIGGYSRTTLNLAATSRVGSGPIIRTSATT